MANVTAYKNKDAVIVSYRFRACIGRDEKGKQQFVTKTEKPPIGLTPKKAEKEMQRRADEWENKLKKGLAPVENHSFKYFVEEIWWKNHVMNGEHKPATIEFYRNMKPRIIERFGTCKLTNIKSVDIEKFLNEIRADGLSTTTIKHYQNVLRIMFGYAEKHDLIEKNPMRKINPIKSEAKQVDFLTPEQAKTFLQALENAPIKWRCMMNLFILCGLRRGEVVGLQWRDIDFEAKTLSVNRSVGYTPEKGVTIGKPKSENSIRTLPLSAPVLSLLAEWKEQQAEENGKTIIFPKAYIFSIEASIFEPMFPTTPTRWLSRFIKANKLPNVSPHDLRHTCGSLMLASGATIKDTQDFLGHEDAKTTLKFYAGTTPETLRKAADGLAAVLE